MGQEPEETLTAERRRDPRIHSSSNGKLLSSCVATLPTLARTWVTLWSRS